MAPAPASSRSEPVEWPEFHSATDGVHNQPPHVRTLSNFCLLNKKRVCV